MANSICLMVFVALASLTCPVNADPSILGANISLQVTKLTKMVTQMISNILNPILENIVDPFKTLLGGLVKQEMLTSLIDGYTQLGATGLLQLVAPLLNQLITFLEETVKPLATKNQVKCVVDLLTEGRALVDDLIQYLDDSTSKK